VKQPIQTSLMAEFHMALTAQSEKTRMVWLDCLRLVAGVSMVGLHASSDIGGQPFPDFNVNERIGPVLFRAIVYTARTELFLIISLFLLTMSLDERSRSYWATIKEQARRLLLPFAFWVLFFAFYRLVKAGHFGYEDVIWRQLSDPTHWLSYFLLGSVQYHMHFLPTLFGLVLLYPLYRVAVDQPMFGLVVLLCLFTKREVDIWIWSNLQDMDGFTYLVRGVKLVSYAGYGIVAASFYGLTKRGFSKIELRNLFWITLYLSVMMFLIKLVYSHKVILSGDWQYNYNPAYWADFLMPILLFLVFMSAKNATWPPVISTWAPYSFGIYLVHPIFLDVLEVTLWPMGLSPSLYVGLKVLGGIVGSTILVITLSRIKLLAWTVGLGPLPRIKRIKNLVASTK
jgi:surface polysaccharide O-acyltransferase-like enzyme